MYLPPNTTTILQPMDQGVLESMKRRYKKAMLQKLLLEDEEGRSVVEFVKNINIKDVVYMLAAAWDDIPSTTLLKSWNKLLSFNSSPESSSDTSASTPAHTDDQSSSPDEPEPPTPPVSCKSLAQQLNLNLSNKDLSIDVEAWLSDDNNDPGYQLLTDDEIIQQVRNEESDDDSNDEEEGDEVSSSIPINAEVADMLDKCLLLYEQQEESTATSTILLKKIRDLAASKRYNNLKQLKLQSFFK